MGRALKAGLCSRNGMFMSYFIFSRIYVDNEAVVVDDFKETAFPSHKGAMHTQNILTECTHGAHIGDPRNYNVMHKTCSRSSQIK